MNNKYLNLGYCHKAHGIRGGFTFHLENLENSQLENGMTIRIVGENMNSSVSSSGQDFKIEKIQFGNKVICYLEGVQSRNIVDGMVPFEIYMLKENIKRDEGDIFLYEIGECKVFDYKTKNLLGSVERIYDNSVHDILTINIDHELIDIPLVDEFVPEIDLDNKEIFIILPEYI